MFIGDSDTDAEFGGIDVGELLSSLDVAGYDLTDSSNSQTIWDAANSHIPADAIQSSGLDADTVDGLEAGDLRNPKNVAQLSSTDTSTDINQTSWVTIPWNVEYNLDAAYTHDSGTEPGTITFNEDGTYRITVSLAYDASTANVNPGVKLNVNGTRKNTFGLTGYVRNADGHSEGSNVVMRTIEVNSGDTLKVQTTEMGNSGTVTLRSEESILEIEQLSATASMASDADTLDGLDSSQFLRSDTDTTVEGGTFGVNVQSGDGDTIQYTDSSGGAASEYTHRFDDLPLRFLSNGYGETLRFSQDGYVGVRNQSPSYALDVDGIVNTTSDILAGGNVDISGTLSISPTGADADFNLDTESGQDATFKFQKDGSDEWSIHFRDSTGDLEFYNYTTGSKVFRFVGGNDNIELQSGNLLVSDGIINIGGEQVATQTWASDNFNDYSLDVSDSSGVVVSGARNLEFDDSLFDVANPSGSDATLSLLSTLPVDISGDADTVNGYEIQKNGTDGEGIINFKTE